MNPGESSDGRLDSPILLFSPHLPKDNARSSNLVHPSLVTFGHLLPRTPARIRPGDEKRGRWGHWSWGRREGRKGKGEKGRIRPGEKGGWKKIRCITRTGVDRFVWSLIWSQESILLRFFFYLYASPLCLDPHPACRSVLFRENFSRRTVAITIIFVPLLRALPATVSVVTMYIPWDLYLPSRHISFPLIGSMVSPVLYFARLKMSHPLSSKNEGVNCKVYRWHRAIIRLDLKFR